VNVCLRVEMGGPEAGVVDPPSQFVSTHDPRTSAFRGTADALAGGQFRLRIATSGRHEIDASRPQAYSQGVIVVRTVCCKQERRPMTDNPVPVTGGCLCGAVRYEAEAFVKSGYYCHCTQCQKSSGAPAEIGIPIKAGTLTFTNGEPKYYVSSEIGKRGFCEHCGSRLVWRPTDPANDSWTNLAVCSLDNSEDARPCRHTYVDTQLPWYELADQLPRHAQGG